MSITVVLKREKSTASVYKVIALSGVLLFFSGCTLSANIEDLGASSSLVGDNLSPSNPPDSPAAPTTLINKIKNINTSDQPSNPGGFFSYNGYTYFIAETQEHGRELWRTDGTEAGTQLFKDINPGPSSSNISYMKVINGLIYFTAETDEYGNEPWRSDGTSQGTYMLGDLRPGTFGSNPSAFYVYNGSVVLFEASDPGTSIPRLWRTDGTILGTSMVSTTLVPYMLFGEVGDLANNNKRFLFSADDGTHGIELWSTDGTLANTTLVKDIRAGASTGVQFQSQDFGFIIAGNKLYFTAFTGTTKLFVSDGTNAGTVEVGTNIYARGLVYDSVNERLYIKTSTDLKVKSLTNNEPPTVIASISGSFGTTNTRALFTTGELFYYGSDASGSGIWLTDGVTNTKIMDLDPDSTSALLGSPVMESVAGGVVFFARATATGWEPYFVSPSNTTPILLKDINTGAFDSVVYHSIKLMSTGTQMFLAATGPEGQELWVTDGTSLGTRLVKDIWPGVSGSNPQYFSPISAGVILFSAQTLEHGAELWLSDGTAIGTKQLKNINQGGMGSSIYSPLVLNDELFFVAKDADNGWEIWKSNGTESGTIRVSDLGLGSAGYVSGSLVPMLGNAYFYGYDAGLMSIWKLDGTTGLTSALNPTFSATANYASDLFAIDGNLVFSADDPATGLELFKVDGSGDTSLVKDISPGAGDGIDWGAVLYSDGSRLIFNPYRGEEEPWISDGTDAGTFIIKNIIPSGDSYPEGFFANGSKIYFYADDGSNGYELWKTDGTSGGTALVKDINPGASDSWAWPLANIGTKTILRADDGTHGEELWITDGTEAGTVLLKDINPGAGSSSSSNFVQLGTKLLFSVSTSTHGEELWITDGTEAGTQLLKDINPGVANSNPQNMLAVGDVIYFSANDGVHGSELWKTDGTEAGTVLVGDIYTGSGSSSPVPLVVHGGKLYLSANDGIDGDELFIMNQP